jgi:uncharacterized protein YkwD
MEDSMKRHRGVNAPLHRVQRLITPTTCAVVFLCAGQLSTYSADETATKNAPRPTISEHIVTQTNLRRQQRGLAALTTNRQLTAAAQGLADHMAATGSFGHQADGRTVSQRVELQQYRWTFVAENIVFHSDCGQPPDATARLLMQQWLNSPGHLQNILSTQASQIGVGTARAGNGSVYAVQVFATPLQ